MKYKALLTDIEGTTTSIHFVHDELFPLAKKELPEFLHRHSEQVIPQLENLREKIAHDTRRDLASVTTDDVIELLLAYIEQDKKDTDLKVIQGKIWRHAYESGKVKGHLYAEVLGTLQKLHTRSIVLSVYSSGSVEAQQLLFQYSTAGDLSSLFSHYFDTRIGAKREKESYERIARFMEIDPHDILFLSDVEAELDAAAEAGFQVLQVIRPGTEPSERHRHIATFEELNYS